MMFSVPEPAEALSASVPWEALEVDSAAELALVAEPPQPVAANAMAAATPKAKRDLAFFICVTFSLFLFYQSI